VVGGDAELDHFVFVAVVGVELALGGLGIDVVEVLWSEPAGLRHVRRSFGSGTAEAVTFLLVAEFVVAPATVEFGGGAGVGFDGAEEMAIGRGKDFGDRLGDGFLVFGGAEASGTGHGVGENLAGVKDFAGAAGVDGFGGDPGRSGW
jgi:hypothetical protein